MLKIALIGLGTMGQIHADILSKLPGVQFVAVAGQNREKTMKIAGKYGVKPHFSLDELLENTEFEVLDICLPTYLHKEYTVRAAMAGKHVICEKPLALHVNEGIEMIAACADNNVRLFIGHGLRFCPEYANAREKVKAGALGKIGIVRVTRNSAFPSGWNDWYANPSASGGLTLDLLIHDFDWIRWTFGEVERVMAQRVLSMAGSDKLEYVLAAMRMADGTIVHVEGSWAHTSFASKFEIAGDKGMIVENMSDASPLQVFVRTREGGQAGVIVPEGLLHKNPVQQEMEHFVNCLLHGNQPLVTAVDALEALKIARATLESIEIGQPVHFGKTGVN